MYANFTMKGFEEVLEYIIKIFMITFTCKERHREKGIQSQIFSYIRRLKDKTIVVIDKAIVVMESKE